MSLEHRFLLSSIFKVIHKKTRLLEALMFYDALIKCSLVRGLGHWAHAV